METDQQNKEMRLDGDKEGDTSRNSKMKFPKLRIEGCKYYHCIHCTPRYIGETLNNKRMGKPLDGAVHDSGDTVSLLPLTIGMPIQLTQTYIAANRSAEMGSMAAQIDLHSESGKSHSRSMKSTQKYF